MALSAHAMHVTHISKTAENRKSWYYSASQWHRLCDDVQYHLLLSLVLGQYNIQKQPICWKQISVGL